MTTEDDFHAALDAHPDDWQTRLVFADWLEERGDPRGPGYRALAGMRRRPTCDDDDCRWWYTAESHADDVDSVQPAEVLPDDWFTLATKPDEPCHYSERSRREIEDEVAGAFARLPPERRTELLASAAS